MALSGDLEEFPLHELLQILAMGRKTGRLSVTGDACTGDLYLVGGRLQDAVAAQSDGEAAFFLLMNNRRGPFVFSTDAGAGTDGRRPTIVRGLQELLMEASGLTSTPEGVGGE